jgi:hypothetical protein
VFILESRVICKLLVNHLRVVVCLYLNHLYKCMILANPKLLKEFWQRMINCFADLMPSEITCYCKRKECNYHIFTLISLCEMTLEYFKTSFTGHCPLVFIFTSPVILPPSHLSFTKYNSSVFIMSRNTFISCIQYTLLDKNQHIG